MGSEATEKKGVEAPRGSLKRLTNQHPSQVPHQLDRKSVFGSNLNFCQTGEAAGDKKWERSVVRVRSKEPIMVLTVLFVHTATRLSLFRSDFVQSSFEDDPRRNPG